MTTKEMYDRAVAAALALSGIPGARVHLGAGLSEEAIRELAQLGGCVHTSVVFRVPVTPTELPQLYVIDGFRFTAAGVTVEGQGSRPVRPGDERLPGFLCGEGGHSIARAAEILTVKP